MKRMLCGRRHERSDGRAAYRWCKTKGKIGFHNGKIEVEQAECGAAQGRRA